MPSGRGTMSRVERQNDILLRIPTKSYTVKNIQFLRKLLRFVKRNKPVELVQLLKKATASEIKAISEVTQNLLQKTHPLTVRHSAVRHSAEQEQEQDQQLDPLRPFKHLIRRLACKKTTTTDKRKLLLQTNNQRGGLPFLVPLLAPLIGQLLATGIAAAI